VHSPGKVDTVAAHQSRATMRKVGLTDGNACSLSGKGVRRPAMGQEATPGCGPTFGLAHEEKGTMRRLVTCVWRKAEACHGSGGLPEGNLGGEGSDEWLLSPFL
jgi:hypothetical protein